MQEILDFEGVLLIKVSQTRIIRVKWSFNDVVNFLIKLNIFSKTAAQIIFMQ